MSWPYLLAAFSTLHMLPVAIADAANSEKGMVIRVGNGPAAGTYTVAAQNVLCVSTSNGLAASFKYFEVPDKHKPGVSMRVADANVLSEAQIIVDHPGESKAKTGSLQLTFGNSGEHPTKYLVFGPSATLTQTPAGSETALAFHGASKDGVTIEATAVCTTTMKM